MLALCLQSYMKLMPPKPGQAVLQPLLSPLWLLLHVFSFIVCLTFISVNSIQHFNCTLKSKQTNSLCKQNGLVT